MFIFVFHKGRGVPQDGNEALRWYRRAAEQGYATAQNSLGALYATGQGVPQGFIHAYRWFSLAAAQGDEAARNNRDLASKQMTPAQIAEAQRLAREWKPKHNSDSSATH